MVLQNLTVRELREQIDTQILRDIRLANNQKIRDFYNDANREFWRIEADIARCEIARREGRI